MKLAEATGNAIAASGYRLVYGGGGLGLMGAAARAAKRADGAVLGVIPDFLVSAEHMLDGIETIIVADMHERKMTMYRNADAFIVLPGGIGTIEEVVEMMSWARLQLHQKPIIFLSSNDYWDPFMALIKHTIAEQFSPDWILENVLTSKTADEAVEKIESMWRAPKKELRPVMPVSKA